MCKKYTLALKKFFSIQ